MKKTTVVVDTKNLALYTGGISHWFTPLLAAWVEDQPQIRFLLLGPEFDTSFLPPSGNWEHIALSWPKKLPRSLRHPWYDNVLFPRAIRQLRPDLVFSPYHDVRMPKGLPSVICVHDLCFDEMRDVYPRRIRLYYTMLLRFNLRVATFIVTVSETSLHKLVELYGVKEKNIGLVYNTLPDAFTNSVTASETWKFREKFRGQLLLYTGGSEYRKNISRLIEAFSDLTFEDNGLCLLITGHCDHRWEIALASLPNTKREQIFFLGRLSNAELNVAYHAVDAVVYPSLCEGFGRACLEAMGSGAPLACSDLPVTREVAGDYPIYFDPFDVKKLVEAIKKALNQGRQRPRDDVRFQQETVNDCFLKTMEKVLSRSEL